MCADMSADVLYATSNRIQPYKRGTYDPTSWLANAYLSTLRLRPEFHFYRQVGLVTLTLMISTGSHVESAKGPCSMAWRGCSFENHRLVTSVHSYGVVVHPL